MYLSKFFLFILLTCVGNILVEPNNKAILMGVLNISPESFYKKSIKINENEIQDAVAQMQEFGADIIDVGGMSTAPYLENLIPINLELERLQLAVSAIRQISNIPISIDTMRSDVVEGLLKYEINVINDITGLKYDKKLPRLVSKSELPIILGAYNPRRNFTYTISGDIYDTSTLLLESVKIALDSNIPNEKLIIDPSVGFFRKIGKNPFFSKIDQMNWDLRDLDVISNIKKLHSLSLPICMSISRKSFIGSLFDLDVEDRLIPSLIAEIHCLINGVSLIRTHNVKETRMAISMMELLL